MIKSMTGYGRCEKQFDEYRITAEVKTVNNRYLDIYTKVYKQYSFIEDKLKALVNQYVSRGKVDCFVQIETFREKSKNNIDS